MFYSFRDWITCLLRVTQTLEFLMNSSKVLWVWLYGEIWILLLLVVFVKTMDRAVIMFAMILHIPIHKDARPNNSLSTTICCINKSPRSLWIVLFESNTSFHYMVCFLALFIWYSSFLQLLVVSTSFNGKRKKNKQEGCSRRIEHRSLGLGP